MTILTAILPQAIITPTTVNYANNVIISFVDPSSNTLLDYGTPTTRYYIYFLDTTGNNFYESTYCNGGTSLVMTSKNCTVSVNTLKAAPFYLNNG